MTNLKSTLLSANEEYTEGFKQILPIPPAKKIAVLSCMDVTISIKDISGLKLSDARIIRNAGMNCNR
jgi:carbonic anhydrase